MNDNEITYVWFDEYYDLFTFEDILKVREFRINKPIDNKELSCKIPKHEVPFWANNWRKRK